MRVPLWVVFLVGCLITTVYYQIFNDNGWIFTALSCARIPAAIAGYVMYPRLRCLLKWLILASAAFALGDLLAYNYPLFFGMPYPFPSIADVPYLLFYPLFGYGILAQFRKWGVEIRWRPFLPIAFFITAAVTFWIAWESVPITLGLAVSILYPVGDILLIYCVWCMRKVVSCSASVLLIWSVRVLVVADVLYSWVTIHGTYQPPGDLDWLWLVSYALMGAAMLHGSMRELPRGHSNKGKCAT